MPATSPLLMLALTAPLLFVPVQTGPSRVPTDVAMKQLIKRVDPIVPPEATAARVGGPVIADVIVSPKGTVESVTILAGPPILQAAATEAFRQWVFKPFTRNGRVVPALVLVEVHFPDPIADARQQAALASREATMAYLRGMNACERDLESSLKSMPIFDG
jgi:TonB family protein